MKPQQEDLENCSDTLFLISLSGSEMVTDSGLKIQEMGKLANGAWEKNVFRIRF